LNAVKKTKKASKLSVYRRVVPLQRPYHLSEHLIALHYLRYNSLSMSFGDVKPRTWGPKANFQETYRQDVLEQEQADKAHLLSVLTKINDRKGETGEVLMTMDEEEFLSRMIREREEIIKEIASEMAELREIMLDIHNLVGEQGFMIGSYQRSYLSSCQ
jgi:hypothetical protein